MPRSLLYLIAIASLIVSSSASVEWSEVFSDYFNGTSLNTTNWQNIYAGTGGSNPIWNWDSSNVIINDSLTIRITNDGLGNWTAGGIAQAPWCTCGYEQCDPSQCKDYAGYTDFRVEVRAQIPPISGSSLGPNVVMEDISGPTLLSFIETEDNTRQSIGFTYTINDVNVNKDQDSIDVNATQWHTYTLEQYQGTITQYIDDVVKYNYSAANFSGTPLSLSIRSVIGSWYGSYDNSEAVEYDVTYQYVIICVPSTVNDSDTSTSSSATSSSGYATTSTTFGLPSTSTSTSRYTSTSSTSTSTSTYASTTTSSDPPGPLANTTVVSSIVSITNTTEPLDLSVYSTASDASIASISVPASVLSSLFGRANSSGTADNSSGTPGTIEVAPPDQQALAAASYGAWHALSGSNIISAVFNVTFSGVLSSAVFSENVEFSIEVQQQVNLTEYCLGYINETTGRWQCQDRDLVRLNTSMWVQCTTNHFTAFAIIASPSYSSSSLAGDGYKHGGHSKVTLYLFLLFSHGASK